MIGSFGWISKNKVPFDYLFNFYFIENIKNYYFIIKILLFFVKNYYCNFETSVYLLKFFVYR